MSQLSIGVLLLPVVFFLLLLFFLASKVHIGNNGSWHKSALIAFSAILVLLTEALGAISKINTTWLSTSWGSLILVLTYFGWKSGWLHEGWRAFRDVSPVVEFSAWG